MKCDIRIASEADLSFLLYQHEIKIIREEMTNFRMGEKKKKSMHITDESDMGNELN